MVSLEALELIVAIFVEIGSIEKKTALLSKVCLKPAITVENPAIFTMPVRRHPLILFVVLAGVHIWDKTALEGSWAEGEAEVVLLAARCGQLVGEDAETL